MAAEAATLAPPALGAPPAGRARWRRRAGRAGVYVAMVYVLVTLNFLLPRAMPGDPVQGLLAQGAPGFVHGQETVDRLRSYYGVDKPLVSQYGDYLARLARGDLGRSVTTNASVAADVRRRLPWTLLLMGGSILVGSLVGVLAGVHAGWRRDRPMDRAVTAGLLGLREFPTFLLASLLLLVFAVKLHWLPLAGAQTPFSDTFGPAERALDVGRHLVLPVLVLAVGLAAGNFLVMRAGMVGELGSDYLLLGRAKGLSDRHLKYRYVARNALLPVVALTALQLGFALTGDVLVERVFSYPGLGTMLFDAINARDYPTIQAGFLVISVSVVTLNAAADGLYRRLDPRTLG